LLAGADRSVIPNLTQSILATSPYAGVTTVEVEACQALRTLVIILALSFLTRDKGISLISSWALTCGCAACGDAVSIWSTRIGVARIRLLLASCDGVGHRDVSCYTLAHWVTKPVDITPCVWATRTGEAGVRGRSPGLYLGTAGDGVWLGGESWDTGAYWVTKSVNIALCVGATRSRVTWVWSRNTLIVLADITPTTVWVPFTLPPTPSDCVWLGHIVGETPADWVTRAGHHALCVGSAGRGVTRVRLLNTLVVLADIASTAVRISLTLSLAACDGVWHGNKASQAPADRVAQAVSHAPGVGAAG